MRILIVHCGYPLNQSAGEGVRTMNMARSLKNLGHEICILMTYNVLNFRLKNLKFIQKKDDITQIHIPTFPISKFLELALLYNRIIVWLVAKIVRSQAIQAEITWSASITKFVSSLPLITDFHSDLVPELEATNRSKQFIEKSKRDNIYALKNSHRILCVSQTLHDNLAQTYNAFHEYNILPCSVNFQLFSKERMERREEFRECYGLSDRIVLAYLGGTHQWQCLNETFDIFSRLHKLDNRYYFCLFTNGNLSSFSSKIESIRDSFMTMPLSEDNLVEHLSMIDAGFVIRDNMLLNANSSPTKIGEYMACGAMVIATQYSGDAPFLIKGSGFGFILNSITPEDHEIEKLNETIKEYHKNYCEYSIQVRQYIEYNRDWERNEEKLEVIYGNLS